MIRAVLILASLLASARAMAEWRYAEVESGTRGTAYFLQTDSSVAVKGSDGQEHHPFLQIRCDEDGGQPYLRVHWFAIVDTKLGSDDGPDAVDNVRVQVRVDGKPDISGAWDMTRDESLESTSTHRASALVKALRKASDIRLRVSGGYGKTYDARFDVAGLDAALASLKGHCKRL